MAAKPTEVQLGSEQILELVAEGLSATREAFKRKLDELQIQIDLALREVKLETGESAERTAGRVAQDLVAGPLSDFMGDAQLAVAEAQTELEAVCDDALRTLDNFSEVWRGVHRAYSVLRLKNRDLEFDARKMHLPGEPGRARPIICEAMADSLTVALQEPQAMLADCMEALRTAGRPDLAPDLSPCPLRVQPRAQDAVRKWRSGIDRLTRMRALDDDEQLRLESDYAAGVSRLAEMTSGLNQARKYGIAVCESLENASAIPIRKFPPCKTVMDEVETDDQIETNVQAMHTILRDRAVRLDLAAGRR